MRANLLRTLCAAASATLLLAACPVPIWRGYDYDSRANVPATVPDSIKKGESTREDVLMQFGEPDTVAVDESWVEYGSSYTLGGLILVVFAGSGGAAVGAVDMRFRRMIIEFDRQGVTTEIILESMSCYQYSGAAIGQGQGRNIGGSTKPCLDKLGLDVPEKFHLSSVRE